MTTEKGVIAEAAIARAAIKLGIDVYRPVNDGSRFDMLFDLDGRFERVQWKWVSRYGEVIVARSHRARRNRHGLLRRRYTADEVDAFAAYCEELDRCFFLPIERFEGKTEIRLRLSAARNNQRRRINWADDFDFAATLGRDPGAIAQLGERRLGMAEVAGSSPAGSTHSSD
jgi:hypothetical protein